MMRYLITTAIISALVLAFGFENTLACEIDLKVNSGKKEKYSEGDEIIVKVTVFLTHRNCPEGIEATKFTTSGLKIQSATKWSPVSAGVWERKLKLTAEKPVKKTYTLNASRTCDKEGGFGALKLPGS